MDMESYRPCDKGVKHVHRGAFETEPAQCGADQKTDPVEAVGSLQREQEFGFQEGH